MLELSTSFSKEKLLSGSTTPNFLNIKLTNVYQRSLSATVKVKVPFALGFDKRGLERENRRRIILKPDQEKTIPFQLFAKPNKKGDYEILVKVLIHLERYDRTDKTIEAKATIQVE